MDTLIPSEINRIYTALFREVCPVHRYWGAFRHLFVSGQDVVDVLNDAAGDFVGIIQRLLAHEIVFAIARLTDPKQSAGQQNLCLEQLVHSIDVSQHPQLRQNIEDIYAQSKSKFSFAKVYRNKLLAHHDLATKLGDLSEPPIPTTVDIEDGLKGIRNVMDAVPRYFAGLDVATVNYYDLVTHHGGENRLIARLRTAQGRSSLMAGA